MHVAVYGAVAAVTQTSVCSSGLVSSSSGSTKSSSDSVKIGPQLCGPKNVVVNFQKTVET